MKFLCHVRCVWKDISIVVPQFDCHHSDSAEDNATLQESSRMVRKLSLWELHVNLIRGIIPSSIPFLGNMTCIELTHLCVELISRR